jgi:predicted nucleic acid-binding protein
VNTYFLDTNALVKRYHREYGTDWIDRLFSEHDASFIISDISIIEFYSAIALKVRTGEIDEKNFTSLRKLFAQDIKNRIYKVAEFTASEKKESVNLLLKHSKTNSLKTLDAIQLSIMKSLKDKNIRVVCADEKFCRVILLEGFEVINPLK